MDIMDHHFVIALKDLVPMEFGLIPSPILALKYFVKQLQMLMILGPHHLLD
jgi:hypothetical protein